VRVLVLLDFINFDTILLFKLSFDVLVIFVSILVLLSYFVFRSLGDNTFYLLASPSILFLVGNNFLS